LFRAGVDANHNGIAIAMAAPTAIAITAARMVIESIHIFSFGADLAIRIHG